jgi:hypothetical protein
LAKPGEALSGLAGRSWLKPAGPVFKQGLQDPVPLQAQKPLFHERALLRFNKCDHRKIRSENDHDRID